MIKHVFALLAALSISAAAFAQDYKLEKVATPPPGLPAAYTAMIDPAGYRVVGSKGPWCEVWFRKSIPTGAKPTDTSITLPLAQGTFLAIIRFPGQANDRRGQALKAGVYTMRYSNYPVDGAHQGVAPQRDFGLLTPIANDPDPNAMPNFETLVTQSKTSGTSHPAVFSLEPPSATDLPSVYKEGDNDWVLGVKAGNLPISIIVVGKADA